MLKYEDLHFFSKWRVVGQHNTEYIYQKLFFLYPGGPDCLSIPFRFVAVSEFDYRLPQINCNHDKIQDFSLLQNSLIVCRHS